MKINLAMLKSVFPMRWKKQPLGYVGSDGNILKKTNGEDEVINQFWLVNCSMN